MVANHTRSASSGDCAPPPAHARHIGTAPCTLAIPATLSNRVYARLPIESRRVHAPRHGSHQRRVHSRFHAVKTQNPSSLSATGVSVYRAALSPGSAVFAAYCAGAAAGFLLLFAPSALTPVVNEILIM